jgi:hypothetical protein
MLGLQMEWAEDHAPVKQQVEQQQRYCYCCCLQSLVVVCDPSHLVAARRAFPSSIPEVEGYCFGLGWEYQRYYLHVKWHEAGLSKTKLQSPVRLSVAGGSRYLHLLRPSWS